jgi:hypothetical protein
MEVNVETRGHAKSHSKVRVERGQLCCGRHVECRLTKQVVLPVPATYSATSIRPVGSLMMLLQPAFRFFRYSLLFLWIQEVRNYLKLFIFRRFRKIATIDQYICHFCPTVCLCVRPCVRKELGSHPSREIKTVQTNKRQSV